MAWGIFWLFDVAWVYQVANQLQDQGQLTVKGFNNQLGGVIVNGLWDTLAVEYNYINSLGGM